MQKEAESLCRYLARLDFIRIKFYGYTRWQKTLWEARRWPLPTAPCAMLRWCTTGP